jgi:hypothetical protein
LDDFGRRAKKRNRLLACLAVFSLIAGEQPGSSVVDFGPARKDFHAISPMGRPI